MQSKDNIIIDKKKLKCVTKLKPHKNELAEIIANDLNKQLTLVFRVITREMDALPQIRPDNNY